MKAGGIVIIGVALLGTLFLPAGTPAVEASYTFTADRASQGYLLYSELHAPLDFIFTYLHQVLHDRGTYALRIWKLLGGIAIFLFLLRSRSQVSRSSLIFLGQAIAIAVYLVYPWQNSFSIGEPLLWMLILLNYRHSWPFERGILTGIGIITFPIAALAAIWTIYRRLEERHFSAILPWILGIIWSILGGFAILHLQGQVWNYVHDFWIASWQEMGPPQRWEWFLRGGAVLLVFLLGQSYFHQPYAERRLFRDRLWAGLIALPTATAIPLWIGLLAEIKRSTIPHYIGVALCLGQLIPWGETAWERPLCQITLPPQSCFWGIPPCYIRLSPPYSCDWLTPFRWKSDIQKISWEAFYDRWGSPQHIFDANGTWTEAAYHLPHLSRPYLLRDTSLYGIRLYYRR
ncbi:MAG: hypothetical protein ABDH66_01740 [Bacteroidia bacterium]